jgi:hypothetical protein
VASRLRARGQSIEVLIYRACPSGNAGINKKNASHSTQCVNSKAIPTSQLYQIPGGEGRVHSVS